jgi:hypothetical protein
MPAGALELQAIINNLQSHAGAGLLRLIAAEAQRAAAWIDELFQPSPVDKTDGT